MELNDDHVRTARAKGASERVVLRSHVLRVALLPLVTIVGMDLGLHLGGAFLVEYVFGLPGLGKTAVDAVAAQDGSVVLGVVIFSTFAIVVLNLIVDLAYAWIDPRILLEERR